MVNDKSHILVVDDDDRIRNLLKDYLSENNFIDVDKAITQSGNLKYNTDPDLDILQAVVSKSIKGQTMCYKLGEKVTLVKVFFIN